MRRFNKKKIMLFLMLFIVIPIGVGIAVHYVIANWRPNEFRTLTSITAYAKTLPEFPTSDDNDWEDPHYEAYYHTRNPSLLNQLLRAIGFSRREPFSPKFMSVLMSEITNMNKKMGLINGKNNFVHIKAHKPARIIVFGDVHAAFHSLVRDLNHLHQKGIISDDLRIAAKDKDTYIVFNGDFINRSPHNIDSLILLSLLLKNNPNRVFYVAGKHERNGHWLDFGLKRELFIRGKYQSRQPIPFYNEVMKFFETLPEAVYVSGNKDVNEVLRISFNESQNLGFEESELSASFLEQKDSVKIYEAMIAKKPNQKLEVRAVIKTEDWRIHDRIIHGLGLLDQHDGATDWAVLSSPITVNRVFGSHYDDAFAEVDVDDYVSDATITLTHQDTRKFDGFISEAPLNIISGLKANDHTPYSDIKVASTMSLIRGLPSQARQIKAGLDTRVNEFNQQNGGRKNTIRLYVANDDYVPKIARINTMKNLKEGIHFFLLSLGTPTALSYLDELKQNNGALFFPATGSETLRNENFTHVVHFRGTYEDEARALIRSLRRDNSATKFAIFYQDDAYGRGPFKAAVEELKKMGITDVLGLPYTRGSISMRSQAEQFHKNIPDALGFFSTATAAKELIRQIGIGELITSKLFGLSDLAEVQMGKFMERKGLTMLVASPVPNPFKSTLPIARKFRQAMEKTNNMIDVFAFEGYIAASIFLEAVSRAGKKAPTPQDIISIIENMKDYDFHGLILNFNKKTRSLAKYVWIENGLDEWERYEVK